MPRSCDHSFPSHLMHTPDSSPSDSDQPSLLVPKLDANSICVTTFSCLQMVVSQVYVLVCSRRYSLSKYSKSTCSRFHSHKDLISKESAPSCDCFCFSFVHIKYALSADLTRLDTHFCATSLLLGNLVQLTTSDVFHSVSFIIICPFVRSRIVIDLVSSSSCEDRSLSLSQPCALHKIRTQFLLVCPTLKLFTPSRFIYFYAVELDSCNLFSFLLISFNFIKLIAYFSNPID